MILQTIIPKFPTRHEIYFLFLFLGLPIWWALGMQNFIWPLLAFPLFLSLLLRGGIRLPPGFGIWLLFIVWMIASATRVEGDLRWLAFIYRALMYVSATILFLYIFNASRRDLADRVVVNALAAYWVLVAIGGFLALIFPGVSFRSLAMTFMPQELLNVQFVSDVIQPGFGEVHRILGYPLPRPKTFFAYSNAWGANFALLVPFVLAALVYLKSRLGWMALIALLVASVVPFIFSLSRAAWFSLGLGLAYVAVRFALRGSVRAAGALLLFFTAAGALLSYTPVGQVAADRMATPHSDAGRLSMYQEAMERSKESLLLGFGTPRPSEENPNLPSIGTHGQVWLVLFSHGIPGLALFMGWFLYTLVRSGKGGSPVRLWSHVVILIALLQTPVYELLPMQIHVVMTAAALAWRDITLPVDEVPRRGVPAGFQQVPTSQGGLGGGPAL